MSVVLGLQFPAGRYHATPWDAHVNEAEVEWPPSPWRVLRALVAVWHRKVDPEASRDSELEHLIHSLAEECPYYQLPETVHAHSRHYMPERSGRAERKVLIFDAFARLDPQDELVMIWPELELPRDLRALLGRLLERLGYLGRAESWVEARLLDDWDGSFDCAPSSVTERLSEDVLGEETVRLPLPVPPDTYARWRHEKVMEMGLDSSRLNKRQERLLATLPARLLDALQLESADVRREGWNRPPGMRFVDYHRPARTRRPRRTPTQVAVKQESMPTTARLVLSRLKGTPLPRVEDAVRIGEIVRWTAIRKADDLSQEAGEVPSVLTGHDMGEGNRHEHAFYLPEDADDDGRLDHVVVHAEAGLDRRSLVALDHIRRIWQDDGNEWRVTLEGYGPAQAFDGHAYTGPAKVWLSVSPYLHPWYQKRGFDIGDQIIRECELRRLPTPNLKRLHTIRVKGRDLRPAHFHRFRRKPGLTQPDTRGSFWRLKFSEPVRGPLALGFACHFGLGVFRAEDGGK